MPVEQSRTALTISLITRQSIVATLHMLRTLEAEGQAKSQTDKAGVMRWSLVAEEEGASMELGAEVYFKGRYSPTPDQIRHLGL